MKLSNESCPNGIKVTYGIWLMTKKMRRVNYSRIPVSTPRQTSEATLLEGCHSSIRRKKLTPVHISLCLNGVLRSGAATSGRMGTNGLMRSRNRTIGVKSVQCKSSRNINFVILLYKNEGNGYSQPLMIAVELREAYYNKSRKDREGNERRERGSPRDGSTLDESAVGGFLFGGNGSEEGRERVASGEFGVFLHGGCELRPHLSAAGQPVPTPGPQRPTSRNLLYASRITTQLLRGFKIWPK